MTERQCSDPDCGREVWARGLCSMHYQRERKGSKGRRYATPEEAFLARTEPLLWSGCLIWTGASHPDGYGQISVAGRLEFTHRYAWEREHGPIANGIMIDHRYHCDPACCETSHLREATVIENSRNRRGPGARSRTGLRGVIWRDGKYIATIGAGGRTKYLGRFQTAGEAFEVASKARREEFGEYAGAGLAPAASISIGETK